MPLKVRCKRCGKIHKAPWKTTYCANCNAKLLRITKLPWTVGEYGEFVKE